MHFLVKSVSRSGRRTPQSTAHIVPQASPCSLLFFLKKTGIWFMMKKIRPPLFAPFANRQEEEKFYRELGKMEQREVEGIMQIATSWHEKGREEGITAGQVFLLLKMIKKRFGELPAEVVAKIRVLNSEEIEKIGEALFDLAGIDDLKNLLPARN